MPEISVRGLEMPESPIRKLAPLALDAKKRGVKVYHLNIGQPDLPTPQVGLDALKHIDRSVLEYSPSQGYLSYREKLTNYYKRFNINVSADDIIITAGGKNVTPSELENELKFSPYITDAVVIGDKLPYLTVIIMIDQENVEKYAQDHDVPFSNYASLTRAPEVQALIQGVIDEVNKKFARVEQIKKFFLLDTQLTAEDEELTPTMKLKRKLVQTKYAPQIEAMYRHEVGRGAPGTERG